MFTKGQSVRIHVKRTNFLGPFSIDWESDTLVSIGQNFFYKETGKTADKVRECEYAAWIEDAATPIDVPDDSTLEQARILDIPTYKDHTKVLIWHEDGRTYQNFKQDVEAFMLEHNVLDCHIAPKDYCEEFVTATIREDKSGTELKADIEEKLEAAKKIVANHLSMAKRIETIQKVAQGS